MRPSKAATPEPALVIFVRAVAEVEAEHIGSRIKEGLDHLSPIARWDCRCHCVAKRSEESMSVVVLEEFAGAQPLRPREG